MSKATEQLLDLLKDMGTMKKGIMDNLLKMLGVTKMLENGAQCRR